MFAVQQEALIEHLQEQHYQQYMQQVYQQQLLHQQQQHQQLQHQQPEQSSANAVTLPTSETPAAPVANGISASGDRATPEGADRTSAEEG